METTTMEQDFIQGLNDAPHGASKQNRQFFSIMKDPSQRPKFIITIVILVVAAIVGAILFSKSGKSRDSGASANIGAPPYMDTVPGNSSDTPAYQKVVRQKNQQEARNAEESGSTYVSIPVLQDNQPSLKENDAQGNLQPVQQLPPVPQIQSPQLQISQQTVDEYRRAMEALQASMITQAQALMSNWSPDGYSIVRPAEEARPQNTENTPKEIVQPKEQAREQQNNAQKVLVKAGSNYYGVISMGVNTDYPGPVTATIVNGDIKGARLIGTSQVAYDASVIKFDKMVLPNGNVYQVNVMAFNPESKEYGVATNVDKHYFERYFGLILGSALSGYGKSLSESGKQTIITPNSIIVSNANQDDEHHMKVALGEVGQALANEMKSGVNRPPTIRVANGTPVGIIFLDNVIEK